KYVGKSVISGKTYGFSEPIILNNVAFGDNVKVHIEGKYIGLITINSKIIEKNFRARHLVSEIISETSSDVNIETEQFAKSKRGIFYMLMSVLVFAGFLAVGLVFAVKSGVVKNDSSMFKHKEQDQQTQPVQQTKEQPHATKHYGELGITEQAADSIKHYYDFYKQQGYDDAHIKEALVKAGWKKEILDKVLYSS
ncbi:hypothetical protein KY321_00870, partial [Candidatus Woesearchaeota archaeon]|nr:hypothetical protein [Candidatus Woesearchaeota archaeon]